MGKYYVEATEQEMNALLNILDEFQAKLGGGHDDSNRIKWMNKTDKMLKKAGVDRNPTPHRKTQILEEEDIDDSLEDEPCSVCGDIDGMVNPCCPGYDPLHFKNCGYG